MLRVSHHCRTSCLSCAIISPNDKNRRADGQSNQAVTRETNIRTIKTAGMGQNCPSAPWILSLGIGHRLTLAHAAMPLVQQLGSGLMLVSFKPKNCQLAFVGNNLI